MARLLETLFICLLLTACSGDSGNGNNVPRRRAYMRPALYDTVYTAVPDSITGGTRFSVNSAAHTRSVRPGWLDVAYPAYHAVINVTFSTFHPDSLEAQVDNRLERFTLNLNGLPAQVSHFSSGPYECTVVTTHELSMTPVQFLATDGHSRLISGTSVMQGLDPASTTDSIRPVIDALEYDIIHALRELGN